MRAVCAILLFAFFGAISSARADVIFGGSVSTAELGSTLCSASGGAVGSLNLSCGDSTLYARVNGSGDAYSGTAGLHSFAPYGSIPSGALAQATLQMQLNETYVMTGGTGDVIVNFTILEPAFFAGISCSFVFDGVTQPCPNIVSETVEYGVPFSVQLNFAATGTSFNGDPQDAVLTYDFTQPGLQTTPEPSSILLLMPGLAGVFGMRMRRRDQ